MKKFFGFLVMLMLCVCNVNGQNWYKNISFGFDGNISGDFTMQPTFNIQIGTKLGNTTFNGLEMDYSFGFEKHDVSYHRIGGNFVFGSIIEDGKFEPYFKIGAAYKLYIIDFDYYDNISLCDIKFGLGFNYKIDETFSILFGIDLTNGFNDKISFDMKNTLFSPKIGIGIHF